MWSSGRASTGLSQDRAGVVLDAGRSGASWGTVPRQWVGQGVGRPGTQDLLPLCSLPAVSTLEKTLPQLLAKLNLLQDHGYTTPAWLCQPVSAVELIAQARGAASKVGECQGQVSIWETRRRTLTGRVSPQVKVPMKFNGSSGVQLRTPRDLTNLAPTLPSSSTLQSPEPTAGQVTGDQFVLYMGSPGSRQALHGWVELGLRVGAGGCSGGPGPTGSPVPRPLETTWVWLYGPEGTLGVPQVGCSGPPGTSIDEDIGSSSQPSALTGRTPSPHSTPPPPSVATCPHSPPTSALRILQFGRMSVTVENRDGPRDQGTVAPGAEGLLNVQPDDFVSTWGLPQQLHR